MAAFCAKCGNALNESSAFCPACGAPVSASTNPSYAPYVPAATNSGLDQNLAAMLSYVLGWVTGIVFLLIDKRPFVRFHAAQSIVVFGGLFIIRIVLAFALDSTYFFGFGVLHLLLYFLFGMLAFVLWIVLMIQAYQGKTLRLPVAAGIADSIAGKVQA